MMSRIFLFVSVMVNFGLTIAMADGTTPAAPEQAPAWMQFVPFIAIVGVFYFFIILPQSKKQKEAQSFLSSLKVGDQVVTNAGILGRITALTEQVVTLEVAAEVLIKVLRSQILMPQSALQSKKEGK
jgi:preprotein translocase subunit YajC